YYYDGGLGDQAWIGDLEINSAFLDAFSKAEHVNILNLENELIYLFHARGAATGARDITRICGIGLN
ncbi:MAG: hypothetical protein ACU0BB_13390, partial [Paracoccaceae bacterium]